ncbi:MAG: restriction endonuclease subunit S [Ignavibacteria bacterium]|jgi:hypothetical protein
MKIFYDYFDIEYGQGKYTSKRFLNDNIGTIPLISSKGINNGIYGFYNIEPKYKNVITVPRTGSIGMAFYQNYFCCVDDNCLVLIPKKVMSDTKMLYFTFLIRQNKYRFVYGRQITPDRLGNIKIPKNFPKWINNIKVKNIDDINKSFKKLNLRLLPNLWKWFLFKDLFDLKKGKRLTKVNMYKGNTPFIAAIDKNNGYRQYIGQKPIHQKNTITVNYNGSVAETFYQPIPYWATDDINVLYPKFELNKYIGMFLVTIIKKEKYRFNYGRKWHLERMYESKIKLPVNNKSKPDWAFMENYIKSLPYSKYLE